MNISYETLIDFHGHSCPGLAIGYRMTVLAMDFLSRRRAQDEELVAIVENDACGVDALQCISGCTFGKGNLLFKDYGKQVYTLYCRSSQKGVRVVFNEAGVPEAVRSDRDRYTRWLQAAPEDGFLSIKEVFIEEPQPARVMQSVKCDRCGEAVMVTRTRTVGAAILCIPCVGPYLAENISFGL